VKSLFPVALLSLSACLPPINAVPVVGAASVLISHGSAQSPEGGSVGTLLSQTLPPSPNVKALRISAWGASGAQGNPRAFYLYVGSALPIAVNIEAPLSWFRCEVEVVKAVDKAFYSSVCFVGDLAGATVTSVHSMDGPLNWAEPIVIRGAGKGVLLGDVTQTGLIVETLN